MFLYGIGILYGRQFFEGMAGSAGRKYNLIAFIGCIAGLFVALGLGKLYGIQIGQTLGIYAGSMTSTATLQAALDVMKNGPVYRIFGGLSFRSDRSDFASISLTRLVKPKFPPKTQRFHMAEISLGRIPASAQRLDEITRDLPSEVQVTMVRKEGHNFVPADDLMVSAGDGLLVISEREDAIAEAAGRLGRVEPGRLVKDRRDLDYIRVFVGKADIVGVPLGKLPLPQGFPTHLLHVRRYDADLVPFP